MAAFTASTQTTSKSRVRFHGLLAALILLLSTSGCDNGDSDGLSLADANRINVTGGVSSFPGGGGGDLAVAEQMNGAWSGTGTVTSGTAALMPQPEAIQMVDRSEPRAVDAAHFINLAPPSGGLINFNTEITTLIHGGMIGNYADDQTNAGQLRGSVIPGNTIILEGSFVGGKTVFEGTLASGGQTFTGTFEVQDAAGAAQYGGLVTLTRYGEVRDLGALAFICHEASVDDFDMWIIGPNGQEHRFYSPGYDDSVSDSGLPDIMVFGGNGGPPALTGSYNVRVQLFSNFTNAPKSVTLEAWVNGQYAAQLWQQTLPGNVPSQTFVAEVNYSYVGGGFHTNPDANADD